MNQKSHQKYIVRRNVFRLKYVHTCKYNCTPKIEKVLSVGYVMRYLLVLSDINMEYEKIFHE